MQAPRIWIKLTSTLIVAGALSSSWGAQTRNPRPVDAANGGWTGRWEGTIFVKPAQLEVDVSVELDAADGGHPVGRISLPQQDISGRALEDVRLEGRSISFVFSDQGVRSSFAGVATPDGRIAGRIEEQGKVYAFELARSAAPAAPPPAATVQRLSENGAELTSLFERDRGMVRLIMILSPTCEFCRNHARIVRNYILRRISNPRLRVYAVWEDILPGDGAPAAAAASVLLPDPRVTQFTSPHRFTGSAFQHALGLKQSLPWDVVLAFAPASRWEDALAAPLPDFYMHNLHAGSELPEAKRINGVTLAASVERLLAAAGAAGPAGPAAP